MHHNIGIVQESEIDSIARFLDISGIFLLWVVGTTALQVNYYGPKANQRPLISEV